MKHQTWLLIAILIFVVLQSGCAMFKSNINQTAQQEKIKVANVVAPNPEAERILEQEFEKGALTVPWDKERLEKVILSRNTLNGLAMSVKDSLNFNGEIPYWTHKAWFQFTVNHYLKLQTELDARVAIEGAISDEGKVIYELVKNNILISLEEHRVKISSVEESIEDKANEDTIQDMKNIYNTLSPLVKGLTKVVL